MGNWNGTNVDKEKDVLKILEDLNINLSDAKKNIKLLQEAGAEPRDKHADPNRLQDTIHHIDDKLKEAAKDFNDIARRFSEKWQYYGKINDDASRQGKYLLKDPAAKKRKVEIQLYCAQKTDMTDYAMEELEKKLTSEQFHHGMKVTVQTRKTLSSMIPGNPLIVICLNSSRLGVDFRNAVSTIPDRSNTAVLIFHLLKEHALPTQPSNTVLPKAEIRNVGTIIDVAFLEDMGLYDCAMNRSACEALLTFIDKHWCKSKAGGSESKEPEPPVRKPSAPLAQRPSPPPKPPRPPALLSLPWRVPYRSNTEQLSRLKMRVENYSLPSHLNATQAMILMIGPMGAGKSSFVNTINSIFQERITQQFFAGSATVSLTMMYRSYEIRSLRTGRSLNFRLCDTRGVEDAKGPVEDAKGPDLADLNYLLEGNVPDGHTFSSASISPDIKEFKHELQRLDEVHCVVFFFDANSVQATDQDTWDKFNQLQNQMNTKGIPRVIVLTKIDKLLESADNDLSKVFLSKDVKMAVEYATEKLRVKLEDVFPIKNYENEINLHGEISCLALQALDRMLGYANDYLVNQHNLMKLG